MAKKGGKKGNNNAPEQQNTISQDNNNEMKHDNVENAEKSPSLRSPLGTRLFVVVLAHSNN